MLDLSAHIFYKVHFTISACSELVDIQQMLVKNQLQAWLLNKYAKNPAVHTSIYEWDWNDIIVGTDSFAPGISLHSTSYSPDDESGEYIRYWACRITEKQQEHGFVPRTWVTEIGLQQESTHSGILSFVVYYINGNGFFGPTLPVPENNIPGIVKTLLGADHLICSNGSTLLDNKIHYLNAGDGPRFAEVLLDTKRKVPIILIISSNSRPDDVNDARPSIEPVRLLRNVAGNAVVYYAGDPEFSEEITYFLKYQYWCKPGWTRVYNPGLNPANPNDGERHRYISADDVIIRGEDIVYGFLRRIFSREIEYYNEQQMFRCENCDTLKRNAQVRKMRSDFERMLKENQSKDQDMKLANDYIEYLTAENNNMEGIKRDLRDTRDELRQANAALNARQDEFNDLYQRVKEQESALIKSQEYISFPETPLDVGAYYEAVYGDKIAFTNRARDTLTACNTTPSLLWDCFYHMATTLRDLYISNCRTIERSFKEASGFELALGEGSETHKDKELMRERMDRYLNRDIHAEPHVKKGNKDKDPLSVRVYYAFDPESKKIVISFCNGEHLPNATTKRYF